MDTYIIVLNYNDAEETIKFCTAIHNYSTIDKIVIVDNNSTDNSYDSLLKLQDEKIIVLKASENKGYSAGNNLGIKYVLEKNENAKIIISNPDIYISDGSIKRIIQDLDDCNVGLSTGVIYNSDDEIVSNYAWKIPSYWKLIASNFITIYKLLKIIDKGIYFKVDALQQSSSNCLDCDCVPGCFFATRLDVIKHIGLLDERTFLFGEENILGYKLKKGGYLVHVVKDAKINHFESHSIKKEFKANTRRNKFLRDGLIVYLKYYLNVSNLKIKVFKIMFSLSRIENSIINLIAGLVR